MWHLVSSPALGMWVAGTITMPSFDLPPIDALERSCLPRYKFTLGWRAVLLRNSPAVLLHFGMRVSRLGIKFVV